MQHHDLLQSKVKDPVTECVVKTAIFSVRSKAFLMQLGASLSAMLHKGFWAALHAGSAGTRLVWEADTGVLCRCL